MTCTTAITSLSKTLKKLLLQYDFYSLYKQTKYIGKYEIIHNIVSKYVEPLLNYIKYNALVQQLKLNFDAPAYKTIS